MGKAMESCIFCKIIDKKLDTDLLYEDEDIVAFEDIAPRAPYTFLLFPDSILLP